MTTSALSLYQLLASAKSHKPPTDRFLTVLADHLGLSAPDSEAQVVRLLSNLIINVENDIDNLSIDDSMKAHLRRHVAPFNGIKNFSHIHFDVKNALTNFLKPENLNSLTDLHLALTGHVEFRPLGHEAKSLAERFRSLNQEILGSDLPPDLKRVLLKRTGQIASILEHYYAFGAQALQEEIEGLLGAIVVNPPSKGAKSMPLYKKLVAVTSAGLLLLAQADDAASNAMSLSEKVIDFIGFVSGDGEGDVAIIEAEGSEKTVQTP